VNFILGVKEMVVPSSGYFESPFICNTPVVLLPESKLDHVTSETTGSMWSMTLLPTTDMCRIIDMRGKYCRHALQYLPWLD
jgi:hypothetical protein